MFSLEILVMVSTIVFCIGGLLGAVISRTLMPPEQQKELEQSLQLTRQELNQYQQDVAQHFADTSKLVNNLTQSYKDVHEHLVHGAIQLTNAEIGKKILAAGDEALGQESVGSIDDVQPQPPRDWAPKTPGEAGILSEEYGLNDDPSDEIPANNLHRAKTGS